MTNIAGTQTIQFAIRLGNMALFRKSLGHSRLKRPNEKSHPTQKKNTADAGQNTNGVQTNWADSVFFKSVAASIPVPKIAA